MTGVRRRVTRELGTAARFAIVGGVATAVHVATALALFVFGHANVWLANVAGFVASSGVSLLGQHRWVFASSRPLARTAPPFFVVAAAGFAFNNLVVGTLSVGLSAPGTTSLTVAALVTPPVTYAINRFLVF